MRFCLCDATGLLSEWHPLGAPLGLTRPIAGYDLIRSVGSWSEESTGQVTANHSTDCRDSHSGLPTRFQSPR